jgi:hypothetical protein
VSTKKPEVDSSSTLQSSRVSARTAACDDVGSGRMALMPIDLPPDYDDFKAEVLSDQESDDQGVYEVWWSANSRYPDLPLSTRLAIAESVVADLLRDGRVTLVRGEWIGPDHEREPVPNPGDALREATTWQPTPGEPVVWMADA